MELVNSNVINISDEDLETMLDSGDGLIENPGFEYISDIDSNFEASGIELSDADSDTDVEFIEFVPLPDPTDGDVEFIEYVPSPPPILPDLTDHEWFNAVYSIQCTHAECIEARLNCDTHDTVNINDL